jgi:hypothetical protein
MHNMEWPSVEYQFNWVFDIEASSKILYFGPQWLGISVLPSSRPVSEGDEARTGRKISLYISPAGDLDRKAAKCQLFISYDSWALSSQK